MTIERVKPANSLIWGRWGGGWDWKVGVDATSGSAIIYFGWWGFRLKWTAK